MKERLSLTPLVLILLATAGFGQVIREVEPYVTTPPRDADVAIGRTATFSMAAFGFPLVTDYRWSWQANGSSEWIELSNSGPYSGATSPTLVVANVTAEMTGNRYQCTFRNGVGAPGLTSPVTLTVLIPPAILAQPKPQAVRSGGEANFEVAVTGSEPLSYQWSRGNAVLTGETGPVLTVRNVQAGNAGDYTVRVTNRADFVVSAAAALTVAAQDIAPTIATQPANQTTTVGGNATFTVTANGTAPLSFQWRKDGAPIAGATGATLVISGAQTSQGGSYSVAVSNSVGAVTSNAASLTVNFVPPTVTTQPLAQSVSVGGNATFTVAATGTAPLTYQWRRDGTAISGATATTLALTNVQIANGGSYTAAVTNGGGTAISNAAALTVTVGPPTITVQPVAQTVTVGGSATLSVTATGSPPLSYQWTRNRVAIPGATNTSLAIANAQLASAGAYAVTVSNSAGSVTSATVQVSLPATLWATGSDLSAQLGIGTQLQRETATPIMQNVRGISSGSQYSFFLKTDGTLWGAGANTNGQLGDGSFINRYAPVQVATGVNAVASGYLHSFYLRADGTLFATGYNFYGQLGTGNTTTRNTWIQVATGVKDVAAGDYHSLYLKSDGTLWAMGYNASGQLGDGSTTNRSTAVQVATGVSAISAGDSHSVFLKTDGTVWGAGANSNGQLGDGTTTNRSSPVQLGSGATAVAAAGGFSLFLKSDGTMWGTGTNSSGQLGDGTNTQRTVAAQLATGVITMAPGFVHTLFIKSDGTLWGTGNNFYGQLGNGTTTSRNTPAQIATDVKAASVGDLHTVYLRTDGTAWISGYNGSGQLGLGTIGQRSSPVAVSNDVVQVSAGSSYAVFFKTEGTLWGIGSGSAMGDNSSAWRTSPVQVQTGMTNASAGNATSLFLRNDGTLLVSGGNTYGQLGSTAFNGYIPGLRTVTTGVKDVVAAYNFSLFIKTDGTLWAMGDNREGQLGDGTTTQREAPVQIATGVSAANGGYYHALFLKNDGSVWATGRNSSGQLGDGTTTQRTSPVQVGSGAVAVAAGSNHSLYLKSDGTVWATGSNASGQFGNGTFGTGTSSFRSTFVQVASGVSAIAAGDSYSLHLKTDGTLMAMGANSSGQLGDGTTTTRSTPVVVADNVLTMSAYSATTYFVQAAGGGARPTITTPPVGGTFAPGSSVTLSVTATGAGLRDIRWRKDNIEIPGARGATLVIPYMSGADAGSYSAVVSNAAGSVTSAGVLVLMSGPAVITTAPVSQTVTEGNEVVLSATYTGTGPLSYQWNKDGSPVAGATNATLTLANPQGADSGSYTVTVSNALGRQTSTAATLTVRVNPGRLVNLSVLAPISGAGDSFSLGYVVRGASATNPKPLVVRAAGPSLSALGVTGAHSDPKLELYVGATKTGENDNWGGSSTISTAMAAVGAFAYSSTGSRDAAVTLNATSSDNSVRISSGATAPTGSGSVIAEVYEATSTAAFLPTTPRLINFSVLKNVSGSVTLGFVIGGNTGRTILARAVGPTLGTAPFNLSGAMPDPRLELFDSNGRSLAVNDNWGGTTALAAAFSATGAFTLPGTSRDAALLATLNPGNYTVVVTPAPGTAAGRALLEVYEAP